MPRIKKREGKEAGRVVPERQKRTRRTELRGLLKFLFQVEKKWSTWRSALKKSALAGGVRPYFSSEGKGTLVAAGKPV